MGKVYRARDTRLDRQVALKVLWPQLAEHAAAVTRFEREARAAARVRHQNVVKVYDVGATDGYHYLAMEYVAGHSLREILDKPLTGEKVFHYFRQILSGLAAAHDLGVIHRDLKPANILIESTTDTVKLADFGLARIIEDETSLTQSGEMLGTIEYMAPELARGGGAGRQSDLYAAGVILYRMLTGRLPFTGESSAAILEAHESGAYPLATSTVAGLLPQADAVLARLLASDPMNRYADCQAVLTDLRRWQYGEVIAAGLVADEPPEAFRTGRHRVAISRRAWARVAGWFRHQWLEMFDLTELTAVRIRDEVTAAERELGLARCRLEEATLLRNARATRADTVRPEQTLEQVRQEYEMRARRVAELRYAADLTLARRRRAKLEISILGILPVGGRRPGERFLAAVKLFGPVLIIIAGAWYILSPETLLLSPAIRSQIQPAAANRRPAMNPSPSLAIRARHPNSETEIMEDPTDANDAIELEVPGWTTKAPLRTGRAGFAAVVVKEKVFVLGGHVDEQIPPSSGVAGRNRRTAMRTLDTVERYDPARNLWESWGRIAEPVAGINAVTVRGKIYYSFHDIVREYDPQTRLSWQASRLPTQRVDYALAAVGDEIYYIGGFPARGGQTLTNVDVFNPVTGSWRVAAPLGTSRCGAAVAVHAGKIYLIGGRKYDIAPGTAESGNVRGGSLDSMERYDPGTDRWEQMMPLPEMRRMSTLNAVALNDKIYLIGDSRFGQDPPGWVVEYDPRKNSWTEVSLMRAQRLMGRAVAVNREILLVGGNSKLNVPLGLVEGFLPR